MPDWLAYVRHRLDVSQLTAAREAEVVEELARQLEDVYRDALARGESEEAAAAEARRHVVDWESFACDIYRTNRRALRSRTVEWADAAASARVTGDGWAGGLARFSSGLLLDLLQAGRTLRRQPAFAAVVVATLALGIGANAGVFTILDQVLLRPLPVERPGDLVLLSYRGPNSGRVIGNGRYAFSYPMYRDLRDGNRSVVDLCARFQTAVNMMAGTRAERVNAELVSGNYFAVLGLSPSAGRLITPDDDRAAGSPPVVVVSHAIWRSRFGADLGLVGRTIRLNGHPMTIVGVAPAGFNGTQIGAPPDLYVPIAMKAVATPTWDELERRRSQWLEIIGRVRPGASRQQAETALGLTWRRAREQEVLELTRYPESRRKRFVEAPLTLTAGARGLSSLRDQFSTPLALLMGMVGLVLLITCANVANLLLARAPARQREMAIRAALGAGAGRIVRRLLAESMLLATGGGALGIVLAVWTGRLLVGMMPGSGGQALTAAPDARVLGFTALVSVATALLFGLVPALQLARRRPVDALKQEGERVGGAGRGRLRRGLVVAQVALSVLLLVGAGLFARTLWNLRTLDPGFDSRGVWTFSVDPTLSGYDAARTLAFYQRLQEELRRTPGVVEASLANVSPFTDNFMLSTVKVEGYQSKEGEDMNPHVNTVSPGYFKTLGMTLVSGRDFTERDGASGPQVAVITQKMARAYFGGADPVGRRIGFNMSAPPDTEIVGVVKDSKDTLLRDDIARVVYTPYPQTSELSQMTGFARLAPGVRPDLVRQVAERLDPAVPVFDVKSLDTQKTESLFADRMVAMLSVAFGALATLLAAIGIYGVMSYTVARRTREIGLRMALGAGRAGVLWLVMREALVLSVVGAGVGVPVAIAASRLVESQLFGLAGADPPTIVCAAAGLLAISLLAGYLPASHAARVEPLQALRQE